MAARFLDISCVSQRSMAGIAKNPKTQKCSLGLILLILLNNEK